MKKLNITLYILFLASYILGLFTGKEIFSARQKHKGATIEFPSDSIIIDAPVKFDSFGIHPNNDTTLSIDTGYRTQTFTGTRSKVTAITIPKITALTATTHPNYFEGGVIGAIVFLDTINSIMWTGRTIMYCDTINWKIKYDSLWLQKK